MRCYAGDLEEGDLIVAANGLKLLSTGTGMSEPATVPAKGLVVGLIRDQHPFDPNRLCFKAYGSNVFYDIHRAAMVKVAG